MSFIGKLCEKKTVDLSRSAARLAEGRLGQREPERSVKSRLRIVIVGLKILRGVLQVRIKGQFFLP